MEVVKKEAMHFIGLSVRILDATRSQDWISALWDRFHRERIYERIPNQKSSDIYGIYYDYEKDHTKPYSLLACCEVTSVEEVPEGLVAYSVPAAKYEHYKVIGAFPNNLMEAWDTVWKGDPKRRTFKADFEHYGPEFSSSTPRVDLYIGIH